jgi:hypothetical protein
MNLSYVCRRGQVTKHDAAMYVRQSHHINDEYRWLIFVDYVAWPMNVCRRVARLAYVHRFRNIPFSYLLPILFPVPQIQTLSEAWPPRRRPKPMTLTLLSPSATTPTPPSRPDANASPRHWHCCRRPPPPLTSPFIATPDALSLPELAGRPELKKKIIFLVNVLDCLVLYWYWIVKYCIDII